MFHYSNIFVKILAIASLSAALPDRFPPEETWSHRRSPLELPDEEGSSKMLDEQWETFKSNHAKRYTDAKEERTRRAAFMKNLEEIEAHNRLFEKGEETYRMGINKFADLTHDEFVKLISCRLPQKNVSSSSSIPSSMADPDGYGPSRIPDEILQERILPASVDWRPTGAVTRVKNQGDCGSCWAFGAVGAIEGQIYLKTRQVMEPLSEQNLVDCSSRNHGCNGGLSAMAFLDVKKLGGVDTEASYQYEAVKGSCRYNTKTKGGYVNGFVRLPEGSETYLQRAVAFWGPITVAIDATYLHLYHSGIFCHRRCRKGFYDLNHEVLLVGYKSLAPGQDYWIVKNSWGTSWGMEGYILMARNKENCCGIATDPTFPIL